MKYGDLVQSADGTRGVITWIDTRGRTIFGRLLSGEEFGPSIAREWQDTGEPGHVSRLYAEARTLIAEARRKHSGTDIWPTRGREYKIRHVRKLRDQIRLLRRRGMPPEALFEIGCPCGGQTQADVATADLMLGSRGEACSCVTSKVHTACVGHCSESLERAQARRDR